MLVLVLLLLPQLMLRLLEVEVIYQLLLLGQLTIQVMLWLQGQITLSLN